MRLLVLLLSFVAVLLLGRSEAQAQEPSCDADAAREHFERGVSLSDERRPGAARDAYTLSLEHCPRIATAYNLAVVLLELGDVAGVHELIENIRARDFGEPNDTHVEIVDALESEAAEVTTVLRLRVEGADSAEIRVDRIVLGSVEAEQAGTFHIARGRRVVRATSVDGRSEVLERVFADPEAEMVFTFPPRPEEPTQSILTQAVEPQLDSSSVFESPWFWIITAVVIAGATTTAILLTSESDPVEDPDWGRVGFGL